jgi:hypothetical protein
MPSVKNTVIFQVATGATATQLPNAPLQIGAALQAGSVPVTIGTTAAVTSSTGITIPAGTSVPWAGSNTNQLFAMSATASSLSILGN